MLRLVASRAFLLWCGRVCGLLVLYWWVRLLGFVS
jgi:hypothetical protein